MACIIKLPDEHKGVVSFTSQEWQRSISQDQSVINRLTPLKDRWVFLQHHNWQPCTHSSFFDSNLCNHLDLSGGGPCLDMDCCNFSPSYFVPSNEKKIDVLYVARSVSFKRIEAFFSVCKQYLSETHDTTVFFICSVPEVDACPVDPESIYMEMFTREERRRFTSIFIRRDYPFPIDRKTLSLFYSSAKCFIHTSQNERHSRVCSYALASGVPVVGYRDASLFLPSEKRAEPYYYVVNNDSEFVPALIRATQCTNNINDIREQTSETYGIPKLKAKLMQLITRDNNTNREMKGGFFRNLDLRLGRHCQISLLDNNLNISLFDLIQRTVDIGPKIDAEVEDFEKEIENGKHA